MKRSEFKSYDELPLFLNAELVAQVLGIAPSSSYELMHELECRPLWRGAVRPHGAGLPRQLQNGSGEGQDPAIHHQQEPDRTGGGSG